MRSENTSQNLTNQIRDRKVGLFFTGEHGNSKIKESFTNILF